MSDIITTLHPENDADVNLYPNVKKENIPNNSIDRSKLDNDVNGLLDNVGELHISGVATSSIILAKTTNDGVWVGSDTGKWYYWDGSNYIVGGDFIANVESVIYHDDNQLKDHEGNNIYPNLSPDTVISNQDWNISDSGWTNLANTRRFLINYGNDIPVNSKFSLSLQAYYSNNLEYTLLVEIWTNNNGLLNLVNQFTYTCPIHSPNGFYENIIIENMKNTYQYPLLITVRNTGSNPIKYVQTITGDQ